MARPHPALIELRARAQLNSGDGAAALETLKPLLDTETPHAQALVTALRAHLEGGFEGDCEAFISVGAWALAPDAGLPVRFDREQVPCP